MVSEEKLSGRRGSHSGQGSRKVKADGDARRAIGLARKASLLPLQRASLIRCGDQSQAPGEENGS